MAGIYIHIPFCRKICSYCDFYKTTWLQLMPEYRIALELDLERNKSLLNGERIETIYFGGGTPSLMEAKDVAGIVDRIGALFDVSPFCEITLEANPDDLTPAWLYNLRTSTPVNRLSIGIQSFNDETLRMLNRRHNALQALECMNYAKASGFTNITIDLIYGLPKMDLAEWKRNLEIALALGIQHLSAYHLTIEPNTGLSRQVNRGLLRLPEDEESAEQFLLLHEMAEDKGYKHYEISNFAREGFISNHNVNYWLASKYLGIGASAHSYTLDTRRWNVSDVKKYMHALQHGEKYYDSEDIDNLKKFNEYLMVSLRTMWGINTGTMNREFGALAVNAFLKDCEPFISTGMLIRHENNVVMSPEGWLISDHIISRLMHEDRQQ